MTHDNQPAEALAQTLGEQLVAHGALDRVQLDYVRQKQQVTGQLLWRVLIQEGLVSEQAVVRTLAALLEIAFVNVHQLKAPDPQMLSLFNRDLCLTARFLPLQPTDAAEGKELLVLLGDNLPAEVAQIVLRRTGMRCAFVQGQFSRVTQFIRNIFHFAKNPPETLVNHEVARLADDRDHAFTPSHLLDNLLHWAVRERATDIHLTPGAHSLHILFRIDGVLQPVRALPLTLSRLLGFIKLLSDMDISE
ncbi:MAG: secretion system protein, partial [Burkholderiales bacterium]